MLTVTFIDCEGSERNVASMEGNTLMRSAMENNIPGIVATCGGSLSCASCHVHMDDSWIDRVVSRSEEEETLLEFAIDPTPNSRRSCQIVLSTD